MVHRPAIRSSDHRTPTLTESKELSPDELQRLAIAITACGEPVCGTLASSVIAGGRSNLTYLLQDERSRWVLRTPPRVGRTPSAHDVAREHRVTSALARTDVPVARAVLLCEDDSVLGVPFSVAEFIDGDAVRVAGDLDRYDDRRLARVSAGLIEALVALHRVDHVAVGLGDFGRPEGYASRQIRRWSGQWEIVGAEPLRPLAAHLVERLGREVPVQRSAAIVHGDYRIDNTLVVDGGDGVAAIVDWELSTIGDPVTDVASMCAYRHPAFDLIVGEPSAWTSRRLPSADALAEAYERAGGTSLADWDFHQGLAFFKVAVIAAGIDHRFRAGATSGPGFETSGEAVEIYLNLALEALRGQS
jgi:aminoglycoside phosphotransferase (APT) family kinase protein